MGHLCSIIDIDSHGATLLCHPDFAQITVPLEIIQRADPSASLAVLSQRLYEVCFDACGQVSVTFTNRTTSPAPAGHVPFLFE